MRHQEKSEILPPRSDNPLKIYSILRKCLGNTQQYLDVIVALSLENMTAMLSRVRYCELLCSSCGQILQRRAFALTSQKEIVFS